MRVGLWNQIYSFVYMERIQRDTYNGSQGYIGGKQLELRHIGYKQGYLILKQLLSIINRESAMMIIAYKLEDGTEMNTE